MPITYSPPAAPVVSMRDTAANILASAPTTAPALAWATDLQCMMSWDGTNWWRSSSYLDKDLQAPDMGYSQTSNRRGYAPDYISNKQLANVYFGGSSLTKDGGVRYDATGDGGAPAMQAFFNATWNNFVLGVKLRELNGVLQHLPAMGVFWINVWSGNCNETGVNGKAVIQGYASSMGGLPK